MDSPLDAFPPQDAGSDKRPRVDGVPDGTAYIGLDVFAQALSSQPRPRRRGAHGAIARAIAVGAAFNHAVVRCAKALSGLPRFTPAGPRTERLAVIGMTAITSASLALLAVWLAGRAAPASTPPAPAVVLRPALQPARSPQAAPARQPPTAMQTASARQPAPAMATLQRAGVAASTSTPAPPARAAAVPPVRKVPLSAVQPAANANGSRAASRARAAGGRSGLVVVTEPTGARVTINGVGWGSTPLAIPYLPPGAKRIRVTLPGYEGAERVVTVDADRPSQKVHIALREEAETRDPR